MQHSGAERAASSIFSMSAPTRSGKERIFLAPRAGEEGRFFIATCRLGAAVNASAVAFARNCLANRGTGLICRCALERFMEKDDEMAEKSGKHEANAQFAKMLRAEDAKKATSEYESTAAALRAKTERLKALLLARDAAAPEQKSAAPKKGKKKSKARLSEWLDGQAKDGRRG